MKFEGTRRLPAPRAAVWQRLHDIETLRQCIPGCESLADDGAGRYRAVVAASVGPVRARFSGTLTRLNPVAPVSFSLQGEGQGGMAGFGKMTASVELEEAPQGTLLRYRSDASVGGKLAQVGSRLVAVAADKFNAEFFDRFERLVAADAAPAAVSPGAGPDPAAAPRWWRRLIAWLRGRSVRQGALQ